MGEKTDWENQEKNKVAVKARLGELGLQHPKRVCADDGVGRVFEGRCALTSPSILPFLALRPGEWGKVDDGKGRRSRKVTSRQVTQLLDRTVKWKSSPLGLFCRIPVPDWAMISDGQGLV